MVGAPKKTLLKKLIFALLLIGGACLAQATNSFAQDAVESATLEKLGLDLEYQSDGSLSVKQSYYFTEEAKLGSEFKTWVRDTQRGAFFHLAYEIQIVRVSGAADIPITFETERSSDGLYVVIPDPTEYFLTGKELHVFYNMSGMFSQDVYKGAFFENEDLTGPIKNISVQLKDSTNGPLAIESFEHQLYSLDKEVPLNPIKQDPRHLIFEVKEIPMVFPVRFEVNRLQVLGGSENPGLSTSLQRFVFTNLWFIGPLFFLSCLALLAWTLNQERSSRGREYKQRPKPPEGMDPGTMSVLLHGGVSARYFVAITFWLAHRGKLMLEYRPGKKHGHAGKILTKKADLDSATREHERYVWSNLLFQGVDSMSLDRLRSKLTNTRLRTQVRTRLGDYFPHRYPLKHPKALEWWLWPLIYKGLAILILMSMLLVLSSVIGLGMVDLNRWEWIFAFPVTIIGFLLFMSKAQWTQNKADDADREVMEFVTFLERPPQTLSSIAGDQRALSILLPYAIACGTERVLLDLYCGDQTKVHLPSWFLIYGNTKEEVHVSEVKSVLADFIEGMMDVF